MTDIVERLRALHWPPLTMPEAADEIERLRTILLKPDWHVAVANIAAYRRSHAIAVEQTDVPIDHAFLDKPLADVQFGGIVTNRAHQIWRYDDKMEWVKVTTVRELVSLTEHQIMCAPNVGKSTIKAIKAVLAEHGLRLGMILTSPREEKP